MSRSLLLSKACGELLKLVDVPKQPDVGKSYKAGSTWCHQSHLYDGSLLQGTKFQAGNWDMYRGEFPHSSLMGCKEVPLPGCYFSGR